MSRHNPDPIVPSVSLPIPYLSELVSRLPPSPSRSAALLDCEAAMTAGMEAAETAELEDTIRMIKVSEACARSALKHAIEALGVSWTIPSLTIAPPPLPDRL